MQTRSLKTLVWIAKVGSFAKAAEQLNMTLSAVSMQMKALESELGAALFDRSVRPPRLTPMGRAIVEQATELLQREQSLLEICRAGEALVGQFRIGFVTTAAVRLLPGFLDQAQRRAPGASFALETGLSKALQAKVLSGRLDAAIVTDADGLPDKLSAIVLREDPFVFAAHASLTGAGLVGLMRDHRFFHFMPDTGIGKLIAGEMSRHKPGWRSDPVVLDNLEAIMECVSTGLGFTLLPAPDVARYRTEDVVVLPSPNPLRRRLVLAVARGSVTTRHAQALAGLLQQAAAI